MNTPLFSIVIPFHNPGKLILNSINSINNLQYSNFEVIFVDDGTTINKNEIHKLIKEKSNFKFNLVIQDNGGVGKARNAGIEHSIGKWIIFLDCDDSISPQLLNVYEHTILNNTGCQIIFTNFAMVSEDHVQDFPFVNIEKVCTRVFTQKQMSKTFLKRKRIILAPGTAYNLDFLKSNSLCFNKIKWSEDQLFIWECIFKSTKICHINVSMYNYLQNVSTSIMSSTAIDKMIDSYPYFINLAKNSLMPFTKKYLAQRWLFGTMHTVIVRDDYLGFCRIYKECNGRKAINKLIWFGDFKIFLLSLINFIFGYRFLFKTIKRADKNG